MKFQISPIFGYAKKRYPSTSDSINSNNDAITQRLVNADKGNSMSGWQSHKQNKVSCKRCQRKAASSLGVLSGNVLKSKDKHKSIEEGYLSTVALRI